jgi:hypothetical protein
MFQIVKKCYNCFFNKFLILSKILRMKNIKDILYCNLKELMLIQVIVKLTRWDKI